MPPLEQGQGEVEEECVVLDFTDVTQEQSLFQDLQGNLHPRREDALEVSNEIARKS